MSWKTELKKTSLGNKYVLVHKPSKTDLHTFDSKEEAEYVLGILPKFPEKNLTLKQIEGIHQYIADILNTFVPSWAKIEQTFRLKVYRIDLSEAVWEHDGIPYTKYDVVHVPSNTIVKSLSNEDQALQIANQLETHAPFSRVKDASKFTKAQKAKLFEIAFQTMYMRVFASGNESQAELYFFYNINENIGTRAMTAGQAKKSKNWSWRFLGGVNLEMIMGLANRPEYTGKLFVDNGAYTEINQDLSVRIPITKVEMDKVMNLYEKLAKAWGDRLYIVGFDKIGDQKETLKRLKYVKGRLIDLQKKYGVKIMIPVQFGKEYTRVEFHNVLAKLFAGVRWIRGIAFPKGQAKSKQMKEFATFIKNVDPFLDMHILGMSPRNKAFADFEKSILENNLTWMNISMDATIFRLLVGAGGRLTELRRLFADLFEGNFDQFMNQVWEASTGSDRDEFDETEAFAVDMYGVRMFEFDLVRKAMIKSLQHKKFDQFLYDAPPLKWIEKNNNLEKLLWFETYENLAEKVKSYGSSKEKRILKKGDVQSDVYWDTIADLYGDYFADNAGTIETLGANTGAYQSVFNSDVELAMKLDLVMKLEDERKWTTGKGFQRFYYPLASLMVVSELGDKPIIGSRGFN